MPQKIRNIKKCRVKTIVILLGIFLYSTEILCAGIIIKVSASNPSEYSSQTVQVKSYLPRGIKPENVLETGGLKVGYDVNRGQYFVHTETELAPEASESFDVEIEDIWLLDLEYIDEISEHSAFLTGELEDTDYGEIARNLYQEIKKNIATILRRQEEFAVPKVSTVDHIGAYEENLEVLEEIKKAIDSLEKLVITIAGDPGKIMGKSSEGEVIGMGGVMQSQTSGSAQGQQGGAGAGKEGQAPSVEGEKGGPEGLPLMPKIDIKDYEALDTVTYHVTVSNPSRTEKSTVPVVKFLPKKIEVKDVIDLDGLELGFDRETMLYYVHKDEVNLLPGEEKVFKVALRDRWLVKQLELYSLKSYVGNILSALEGYREFNHVQILGGQVLRRMAALLKEMGIPELNEAYLSSFNADQAELKEIWAKVREIERLLVAKGVISSTTIPPDVEVQEEKEQWVMSEDRFNRIQTLKAALGKNGMRAMGNEVLSNTIFQGRAPTMTTTWVVIFMIMGFLGVICVIWMSAFSNQLKRQKNIDKALQTEHNINQVKE